mmetsp:Transcript_2931/g.3762  ORF Transcript_2931/g.3762 Transcript_2931/m.3762 type:complete len:326 (+) Transcript_2931:42-1019(+)
MMNTRTSKRKTASAKSRCTCGVCDRSHRDVADATEESLAVGRRRRRRRRKIKSASDTPNPDNGGSIVTPTIAMTSREDDFNERTWWMVDLTPIAGSSPQGASALVKRCMRTHGWDEAKARKVLNAYRQFMILKKEMKDWDAEILSPCYLVDQMWHCHILDVVNYCHDMMLLCGHVVGHNPDGALDAAGKQKRDETTRASLQGHFGSYDEEVWDYSPDAASENVNDVANQSEAEGAANDESGPPFSDDTKITLRLKGQSGEETMFKLLRTTPMRKMFNTYAAKEGVDVASLRFTLGGELISYDDTPAILELEDLDQMDVAYQQLGC